jgi:hypothetical protein
MGCRTSEGAAYETGFPRVESDPGVKTERTCYFISEFIRRVGDTEGIRMGILQVATRINIT